MTTDAYLQPPTATYPKLCEAQERDRNTPKHRTNPIAESISRIPGYPSKLIVYRLAASQYWWVRYYANGKIFRRTTKEIDKKAAYEFAKRFFEEIIIRRRENLAPAKRTSFQACAMDMLKSQEAQLARGEISAITHQNTKYRIYKTVLPFFGSYDVSVIKYELLEEFLNLLSKRKPQLSSVTINAYIKLVRRVLSEAVDKEIILRLPKFPRLKVEDQPRGHFTVREYRRLRSLARTLQGKSFDVRKAADENGKEDAAQYTQAGKSHTGRLVRRVTISEDLNDLITFMVYGFIRSTDIKNIQHKHIEIVRKKSVYLRLRLPISKKHKDPIVTMPRAVLVYEKILKRREGNQGRVSGDDFVFAPQFLRRDYALKEFQRQFDVVMHYSGLREGVNGESRSLYSLRHSCIMFRLLYGGGVDHITLARNARTSPEMIERFYASQLKGEDNVDLLQSKRIRWQL